MSLRSGWYVPAQNVAKSESMQAYVYSQEQLLFDYDCDVPDFLALARVGFYYSLAIACSFITSTVQLS